MFNRFKTVFFLSAALLLCTRGGATGPPLLSYKVSCTSPILSETLFINIIRDMELFNSWVVEKAYPPELLDSLRHQTYQQILDLYKVDSSTFKESSKYYLESSIERALAIYQQVHAALKILLPPDQC